LAAAAEKPVTAGSVCDTPFRSSLTAAMVSPVKARFAPWTVTPWLEALLNGELIDVIVGGGARTLNVTPLVVPPGVVTVMVRLPCAAAAVMLNVAVIWVVPVITMFEAVIPAPALMLVAPFKLVPVRVTLLREVPAGWDAGLMLVSVGTMPNVTALLVPFGFVTEMAVVVAPAVVTTVALICVSLTIAKTLALTPEPTPKFSEVVPVKPRPASVTGTVTPAPTALGVTVFSSGARANTVRVTGVVVPPGVVIVKLAVPRVALPAIRTLCVSEVKLVVGVPTSEMPAGTFTVPPIRPVPVKMSGMVAPVPPVAGESADTVGVGAVTLNVTVLLAPLRSLTETVYVWTAVLAGIVKVAVTELAVATMAEAAKFAGVTVTVVTPPRLVPANVTLGAVPALVVLGVMLVRCGRTTKVTDALVPPGPVTEMLYGPAVTVEAMLMVAEMLVPAGRITGVPTTAKFAGRFSEAPTRSVPVSTIEVDGRAPPELGAMPVSTGAGAWIVNVTNCVLEPLGVVTTTFCAPSGALAAMVKSAVMEVPAALTRVLVMVTPGIGLIVPLPKFAPAIVTGTAALPRNPDTGAILVTAGGPMRTVKVEATDAVVAVPRRTDWTPMLQGPSGPTGLTLNVAVI